MIFHCGTNALKGIFKKYPLLELKSSKNAVVNKFKNLIKTYSYARKIISNQIKKKNYFFEHKFQRIIANLFIVLSKLKIENSEYIEISKLFIDFFKIETNIAWHAVDNIQYIIFKSDNSTLFTAEQLEELINITYVKPYGKHGLLQIFAEALEKYYPKYTLRSNRIYSIIVRNYSEDKFSDLISLWRISDSKTKLKISKFFLDKMTNKFDDELYSYVALETIVDYKPFFKQYLIKLLPYKNIWGYERVGNNLVSYYPPLNWIISFVYKFQIDTKSEELKELAQSHEYFNWLLNLETFDYSKFKLEWIAVYEHISYFQKFKTIPVLKLQIEKKLKEHYDSFLSEIYYKKIG
jgi:hypothetical protein